MKILLVNKFHFLKGGSESVYFNTQKLLEQAGHQVICFSMQDKRNLPSPQKDYFVENIDFENSDNWLKKSWHYLYSRQAKEKMEMLLNDEKPDLVHLHNFSHQLTNAILEPIARRQIPIVQTLHDYQWICPNYQLFIDGRICERCKKHQYYQAALHKCLKNSRAKSWLGAIDSYWQYLCQDYKKINLFLSPSRFLKEKFQEFGFDSRIEVLPNCVEIANYQPSYDSQPYIVFAGRLSPEKGLLNLLAVMQMLPAIKLKVLGDGPQKEQIVRFLSQNKINNVEILGTKNGQEFKDILANSRFLIMPSSWHENFPMVALEAMALGKPVLASRVGGLPEIVTHGVNGWLYETNKPGDLKKLIEQNFDDLAALTNLGKQARGKVEKEFSSEIYLQKLLEFYLVVSEKTKVSLG